MRRLMVLAALLALSAAAPAKLYKWVDKDGNVTYSERKPPDVQAEEVKVQGVAPVTNEEARERLDSIGSKADEERKDREFKETYAAETAERDARLKENCKTARENLRVLETASRIKDAEGNYVDESTRESRISQAKQNIADNCE